jgi:hypothetical protein
MWALAASGSDSGLVTRTAFKAVRLRAKPRSGGFDSHPLPPTTVEPTAPPPAAPRTFAQAQASNVTNHPNYANPVTDLSSPNYGKITSLAAGTLGSRVIVLGARFVF